MAEINGTVGGATPPIAIVVRKVGETTGNRCIGACNTFPVDFTQDAGTHQYYFIVTDSSGCVVDSRIIQSGIGTVNCDVTQPTFDASFTQPVCIEDGYQPGVIHLTNLLNATRYKICYNTVTMNCAACTESDGVISGTSMDITVDTPTTPTNRGVLLRVYNGSGCEAYNEYFTTMTTPNCAPSATPEFAVEKLQPYCREDGTIQNAVLKLTNIQNATRYKICYNSSTFSSSCNASCSTSDGIITGTAFDIDITSPAPGVSQNNVIRIYNGAGCSVFVDVDFPINSPNCSINQYTVINLDLQIPSYTTQTFCEQPNTYNSTYDFYVTPNTVGLESINGQKSKIGNTSERNLPNGNDVPNTYISAGFKPSCANPGTADSFILSIFYRFSFNVSNLKANFPNVNTFVFDVYGVRTKDTQNVDRNKITVVTNAFPKTRSVRLLHSNNSVDAYRDPLVVGTAVTTSLQYNPAITGFRKIGTLTFNYATNSLVWTPT